MSAGPDGPRHSQPSRPQERRDLPRRIVLTGFMGAGKSTVGQLLAVRLGWPFLDIDPLIAAEQQLSVADIFAQHGEKYFRRLEAEAVARALYPAHELPRAIVALGGGAIESPAVRDLLFSKGYPGISVTDPVTIYLSAPLDELLARCAEKNAQPPMRPLLAAPEPPAARLERRLPHYHRAHLTIETAGIGPAQVVDAILAQLNRPFLESASRSSHQSAQ